MLLWPHCNVKMQYNLVAVFISVLFETVRGHYGYIQIQCRVSDSKQNTEFILSVIYNRIEFLRYNSTENKAIGYTEFGKKYAEEFNKNIFVHEQTKFLLNQCKIFGEFVVPASSITVPPDVIIRLDNVNQKDILVCSAYDFFPKLIKLTWVRDDKVITADVTSIEQYNGDGLFQIHSYLEYFPKPGEKISCVVEHASSNKPMIYHWDPSLPESERSKIILGSVGLLMGVFMAAGGLIYYKRKHTGFYRLPACLLSMETMNGAEQQ